MKSPLIFTFVQTALLAHFDMQYYAMSINCVCVCVSVSEGVRYNICSRCGILWPPGPISMLVYCSYYKAMNHGSFRVEVPTILNYATYFSSNLAIESHIVKFVFPFL